MLAAFRFRNQKLGLGLWIIGSIKETEDLVEVREGVYLIEMVNQQGHVSHSYMTDDLITPGMVTYDIDIFDAYREITDGDPLQKAYQQGLSAYRVQKAGIVDPSAVQPMPTAPRSKEKTQVRRQ